MAIRSVVTRGFGNGTFNGTIPLVATRGYAIGSAVVVEETVDTFAARGGRYDRRYQREQERRLKLETELRELYTGVVEQATSPEAVAAAVEVVSPAIKEPSAPASLPPPPPSIDWSALAGDARQARLALNTLRLVATREVALRARARVEEEAAIFLLLMMP